MELAEQALVKTTFQTNLSDRLKSLNKQFFAYMKAYNLGEQYTYYEFLDCFQSFDRINHSWRGFPAREAFTDNIQKTAFVILTHGFEGLEGDPKKMFASHSGENYF